MRRTAFALGLLGWMIAVALPLAVPVFGLPPPSGPHAIGTLSYVWLDETRPELVNVDPTIRRRLMAQI